MKIMRSLLLSLSFVLLTSHPLFAAVVTSGEVAELAAHKIEHLANLGKLDEAFLTKFSTLEIVKLKVSTPAGPAFKVTATQYAGADGSANSIELIMNESGKTISQSIKIGAEAVSAPIWRQMEALSYVEHSLHFLEDSTSLEVKPFLSGLSFVKLNQVKDENGNILARVDMTAKDSNNILEITMKEDGTVASVTTAIHP